ncbi:hypothetical protein ACQ4M4_17790 [Leptolyngbya sp. AN02str]|uniref:hypothetical protein n=1 Tax=Leptolyngbya sp. AN02str TaxID=3423363 RepID=UPI003D31AF75
MDQTHEGKPNRIEPIANLDQLAKYPAGTKPATKPSSSTGQPIWAIAVHACLAG